MRGRAAMRTAERVDSGQHESENAVCWSWSEEGRWPGTSAAPVCDVADEDDDESYFIDDDEDDDYEEDYDEWEDDEELDGDDYEDDEDDEDL